MTQDSDHPPMADPQRADTSIWVFRCLSCGLTFTTTYGEGQAFCQELSCQAVCNADHPA